MSKTVMIIPIGSSVGLTLITSGIVKAIENQKVKVSFFQPFLQNSEQSKSENLGLSCEEVENYICEGHLGDLLETIVEQHHEYAKNSEIVVLKGAQCHRCQPHFPRLNMEIAQTLDANIIFVSMANGTSAEEMQKNVVIFSRLFGKVPSEKILGCLFIDPHGDFVDALKNSSILDQYGINTLGVLTFGHQVDNVEMNEEMILNNIKTDWIKKVLNKKQSEVLTPAIFRHQLVQKATEKNKKILLPEGNDIRVLTAANICAERKIARIVTFGKQAEIKKIAQENSLKLSSNLEIIDPDTIRDQYVDSLVEARKHKGMTEEKAKEELKLHTMLSTMMLKHNEVDGLVLGAATTTADSIRPAFQVIGTTPGCKLVSSVMFMCLPDQVLVYGDISVNPDPNADQLADIAIQSAETAKTFGIAPIVSLVSYSTGASGHGASVDKVREAAVIAKEKRPDLLIDGPLQYDAAIDPSVGKLKAPNSHVAGKATVFVFPNIDAGNICYKAVQRSTHILCVGPVLQGLAKPVNDLSRGCSVKDIIYTVALTALQAK